MEEAGDERRHELLTNGVAKDVTKPSECDSAVAVMVDDQGEQSGQYEQGEGIRQHLIDCHAKFVAKAFLYPDLSSSIHYWLMACVEYGTPPNDPMVTQICPLTDGEALAATTNFRYFSEYDTSTLVEIVRDGVDVRACRCAFFARHRDVPDVGAIDGCSMTSVAMHEGDEYFKLAEKLNADESFEASPKVPGSGSSLAPYPKPNSASTTPSLPSSSDL
ncbi:hypothetical protein Aduo_010213 [Ancylostoma duodenale]